VASTIRRRVSRWRSARFFISYLRFSPISINTIPNDIPLLPPANQGPLDEEAVDAVREKYGLEMDMGSIPVLAERHGLAVDAPPPSEK
jgi:hypothetical protein